MPTCKSILRHLYSVHWSIYLGTPLLINPLRRRLWYQDNNHGNVDRCLGWKRGISMLWCRGSLKKSKSNQTRFWFLYHGQKLTNDLCECGKTALAAIRGGGFGFRRVKGAYRGPCAGESYHTLEMTFLGPYKHSDRLTFSPSWQRSNFPFWAPQWQGLTGRKGGGWEGVLSVFVVPPIAFFYLLEWMGCGRAGGFVQILG